MTKDKALVGAAGVHYVAFQLSAWGYAVGVTAPGVKLVDLIATNTETGESVNLQVKTMMNAKVSSKKWGVYWKWPAGKALAALARAGGRPDLFVACVDLRRPKENCDVSVDPQVFIVPSRNLKAILEEFPGWHWIVIPEARARKLGWKSLRDVLGG